MPDLKISLIHPSRGRPEKALATAHRWISRAITQVEHIISVDFSDERINTYRKLFPLNLFQSDNDSVVEATNKAARMATGDILIYLSDDFDCPESWDLLVRKEFEHENRPILIKVDDCLQPFSVRVLTIPIMNRQLYNQLGYFWHPGYRSMYVDEDLYHTAVKRNALKMTPHLKFPHIHPANPNPALRCDDDAIYQRSAANWGQGEAMFAQRKAAGFP